MALYPIPNVGSIGRYKVSPPFNTVLDETIMYACQAVRSLTDMIAAGDDPYGTIYAPIGITEPDFNLDVKDKVVMVSLTAGGTKFIDIPSKYLLSTPTAVGVTYQSKALSINLFSLPKVGVDLPGLISDIHDTIRTSIGITPTINELDTSPEFKIDYRIHDTNTAARLGNISNNKSYKTKYEELLIVLNKSNMQIAELEQYIKDKLP